MNLMEKILDQINQRVVREGANKSIFTRLLVTKFREKYLGYSQWTLIKQLVA